MGVFTQLDDAALASIADAFALGSITRATPIAAGTINTNVALDTTTGRWFARVNEGKAEADVAWEADLVGALAVRGIPTPPPRRTVERRPYAPLGATGKWVSVFPWRAGRHLAADEVTPAHATALGAALAGLHEAGRALPSYARPSIYDHAQLVARYRSFSASDDPVLAPAIAVIGEELAAAEAATETRRAATHGIIHGDLFRDNVLWEPDRPTPEEERASSARAMRTIAALLDFEQASHGSLAYDVAVCIHDWCWTGAPRFELIAALLEGYQGVRRLTAADRRALPVEIRAAAVRFTITRITDVYLARVDNPEKDFRAFLARSEAWRRALGRLEALL